MSMVRKYRLSQNELTLWLNYIEHQVGFVLPMGQISWVKGIIERHLESNQKNTTDFLEAIVDDAQLYHNLFDDILIPRTQFFRHADTFEFMKKYARMWFNLHHKTELDSLTKTFTVWSVGCSTGQEPLSALLSLLPVVQNHNFMVYGSDFSQQSLQTARKGDYNLEELVHVPESYRRYLQLDKTSFRLNPVLTNHLQFFSKNLVDYEQAIPLVQKQCQVIICKNVLIYFRQFEQRDIINYLTQFLADDGILLLGVGELIKYQGTQLARLPKTKIQINAFCKLNAPDWLKKVGE